MLENLIGQRLHPVITCEDCALEELAMQLNLCTKERFKLFRLSSHVKEDINKCYGEDQFQAFTPNLLLNLFPIFRCATFLRNMPLWDEQIRLWKYMKFVQQNFLLVIHWADVRVVVCILKKTQQTDATQCLMCWLLLLNKFPFSIVPHF